MDPVPYSRQAEAPSEADAQGSYGPIEDRGASSELELQLVEEQRQRRGPHGEASQPVGRTWRQELPRWLATLNPGRTGIEYERALSYFFETPGVPAELAAITFDLLLAYRGSLAMRASSPDRAHARRDAHSSTPQSQSKLGPAWMAALPRTADEPASETTEGARGPASRGLLAPATVNIRLTALRQFLVHCALVDLLPTLTPDRIRGALRRLSIERRRPYQILAQPEWNGFLDAALAPISSGQIERRSPDVAHVPVDSTQPTPPSPWGLSRAERVERRRSATTAAQHDTEPDDVAGTSPSNSDKSFVRSTAGLTGVRTAQRDHALLSLALATGLRAIELVSLDVGDLVRDWHDGHEEWWLVLQDSKTKGQRGGRTLPLAPSLMTILLAYITSTGRRWEAASDRATPLFLSWRGRISSTSDAAAATSARRNRLTVRQVERIVDRVESQWSNAEGANRNASAVSPHSLRHSTAVALLEGDVESGRAPASVEHVRGWLGHFDIRTTQGYLAHLEGRKHRRPLTISLAVAPLHRSWT